MSDSKKKLVDFEEPAERPSKIWAKQFVDDLVNGREPVSFGPKNILDGYDDFDYVPGLTQIQEWVDRETEAMRQAMAEDPAGAAINPEDPLGDFHQKVVAAFDAFSKNEIDEDAFAEAIAKIFRWLDNSPFWGGTPLEAYWHAAKAQSALLKIHANSSINVDCLYDLINGRVHEQLRRLEGLLLGRVDASNPDEFSDEIAQHMETIQTALSAQAETVEFAVKLGFLYRDSWWLEKHGDAALRGYLAKETAMKAGVGGSKASQQARRIRIDLFLEAHAEMMRQNKILVDDSSAANAFRALKMARRAHGTIFKTGITKKTAVDYWDHIKSDAVLFARYQELLLNNNNVSE